MPQKIPRWWWIVIPLAYFAYIHGLGATGVLGPDEPRYAAIGREMARSGDWVSPRLWGEGWYEKPALLYWMTAAATRAGLSPDWAPRLPVAICSLAFLVFFWWILRREFGSRTGWYGALMLGTSCAWVGFSGVGVTDLPLSATFSAAMLLGMPWMAKGERRMLPWASAALGLAVLAKGLVPLVLVLPLLWMARRAWRDLLHPAVWLPFLVVALPWYVLCYLRNGRVFIDVFFIKHHFSRFSSDALMHRQPWWFYLPILLAALLPWTPLLFATLRRKLFVDRRVTLLAAWLVFGMVFFSAATNKLPGYLLPLLPAVVALAAIGLDSLENARWWLAACALLVTVYVAAVPVLPGALAYGLSRAPRTGIAWTWLAPAAVACAAAWWEGRGRRPAAVLLVAAASVCGIFYLRTACAGEIDRRVSARPLWLEIASRREQVCVTPVHRALRYGLNYYSVTPLPDCREDAPTPLRVIELPGEPPKLAGANE